VIPVRFLLPNAVARPLALSSAVAALLVATSALPQAAPTEITHPSGERILLYPDGRWEYADPAKRAAMPKPAPSAGAAGTPAASGNPAAAGTPAAATAPSPTAASAARSPAPAAAVTAPPSGASTQGGWLFGRRVPEGDPDFNRGSLNPKVR
jgi:hypothetical protein